MFSRNGTIRMWFVALVAAVSASLTPVQASQLYVGASTISITPDKPVALSGQMRTRIATTVESPVIAAVLAIESREGDKSLDQAVMVACDLVAIREGIVEKVRERLKDRLADLDPEKIFLSATHTHTAPVMREGSYEIPAEGVIQPNEYVEFLSDQVAKAIEEAWKNRQPGSVGWGLGHAVVAQNRRAVYADGSAVMYGKTNRSDFRVLEGYEDHGVEVLFVWDQQDKLIATAVNVACPAQEVEGRSAVNADFWHEIRESLKSAHGENLTVLGWTGAAGDQSPHLMIRSRAEDRMRELRGLTRLQELARRVVHAWNEAYEGASKEKHSDAVLAHQTKEILLSPREISSEEVAAAKQRIAELSASADSTTRIRWHKSVLDRFEKQQAGTAEKYPMELHVIRIGDVAIATNRFELFTDFGVQIKARSPALQTFIIQLAGPGSYLPSARAVAGGGYSAIAESNLVGPKGGQELVDQTLEVIDALWTQK